MVKPTKTALTEGQRLILEHVARYRVSTIDLLHTQLFSGKSRDAAMKAAKRMADDQLLMSFMVGQRLFYQLSPRGASVIGAGRHAGKYLGSQALPALYAVAAFCACAEPRRFKLTVEEFESTFPSLAAEDGIAPKINPYVIEENSGRWILVRVIVDYGASIEQAHRKVRACAGELFNHATLRELTGQGLYMIAVLTGEPSKKRQIEAAILGTSDLGVPVRVVDLEAIREVAP